MRLARRHTAVRRRGRAWIAPARRTRAVGAGELTIPVSTRHSFSDAAEAPTDADERHATQGGLRIKIWDQLTHLVLINHRDFYKGAKPIVAPLAVLMLQ